jgi:CheY-like chemotaxis protein
MSRKDVGGALQDIPEVAGEVTGPPAGPPDVDDITILFVDDERQLLSVLASNLEEDIDDLEIVTASNATEAIERLEKLEIDCIVSDYKMPGTDGLDLLERSREKNPNIPFILFTSKGSEEIASRAINADVTDYLQKDLGGESLTLLSNRIQNAVAERRAREAVEDTLNHLQTIHERVSDAYLGLDGAFRVTYLDEDAATLLQDDRDRLVGERLWDVLPKAVDSPLQTEFERALRTGTSVELETHYEPFDTWFDVRAFPADGGLAVYFRDVTERKVRERKLHDVADALAEMGEHAEMLLALAEDVDDVDAADDGAEADGTEAELLGGLQKLVGGMHSLEEIADPDREAS